MAPLRPRGLFVREPISSLTRRKSSGRRIAAASTTISQGSMAGEMSSDKRLAENGQKGEMGSASRTSIRIWSVAAAAMAVHEKPAQDGAPGLLRSVSEKRNAARARARMNAIEWVVVRFQRK